MRWPMTVSRASIMKPKYNALSQDYVQGTIRGYENQKPVWTSSQQNRNQPHHRHRATSPYTPYKVARASKNHNVLISKERY